MRALTGILVALALAGCASGGASSAVEDSELDELRALGHGPLYWAGKSVAGLPLTHAESAKPGVAFFVYGDCDPPGGLFSDGGCGPPIQIQQFPFDPAQWKIAYQCRRLPTLAGLPAARHDSLVVFSGRLVLKIYARSSAEEKEVAKALRTLDGKRSLAQPPATILAAIGNACGNA